MSYLTSEYDMHDKMFFNENTPDGCDNCDRTDAVLFDITTDDDQHLRMCSDCCDEERRIERLADELAAMPSCDSRAMIIDLAEATRALVNQLQAHDMSCVACASTRKTVQSDRLHVNPAAVCCGEVA